MGRKRLIALVAFVGVMFVPDYAHATTVTLGTRDFSAPSNGYYSCNTFGPGCTGYTVAQLYSPELIDVAPASGLITSWRFRGSGPTQLRVLRPGEEEGEWVGDGASAPETQSDGKPNATSLPIQAGDLIGLDLPAVGAEVVYTNSAESESFASESIIGEGEGQFAEHEYEGEQPLLSADVVLAPVVSSLSPASGDPAGGNAVRIAGLYLDGATSVTFGSTPASSFSVDSASQITAIAPASAASTVDVRVTGPGGSSEVGGEDRYTYAAPSTTTSGTAPVVTLVAPPPGGPVAKPAVSGLGQSASRWRRGKGLPHISSAGAPVGTTFSFSLNEPATASFAFTRRAPGRRAKGRCVAVSPGNANKPKCKRTVNAGSFSLAGHAGLNKATFQGRLSSAKTLPPGTYSLVVTARDSRGLKAASQPLSFTIVPG
jgi:hypothetical protein